jgi:hypothetical protein
LRRTVELVEQQVVEIEFGELLGILLKLEEGLLEPTQIENEEHPGEHGEQAQHPVGDRRHEQRAQFAPGDRSDVSHDASPGPDEMAASKGSAVS